MIGLGDIKNREYDRWVEFMTIQDEMVHSLRNDYWVMTPNDWVGFQECVDALRLHLSGKKFLNLLSLGHIVETLEEVPQLDFKGNELCN